MSDPRDYKWRRVLTPNWETNPPAGHVAIAEALDVQPGHLLGPDDTDQELSQAEMTLIRFIRGVRLAPHDAIVRLSGPQHVDR